MIVVGIKLVIACVVSLSAAIAVADKTVAISSGKTVTGRCVGVHDGDTITLLVDTQDGKRQAKIRLDGIDAPELGQGFSRQSREALAEMVFEKPCEVESRGPDKYGRTIGRVSVERGDVNAAMLDSGMAWHYAKYDHRPEMAAREASARQAQVGLWSESNPIPPWDWRKMSEVERRAVVP